MGYMSDFYGLKEYSLEEEINLPQNIRSTRVCKIEVVDWCNHMLKLVDQIKRRTIEAPELDEDRHAEIVRRFRDNVNEAMLLVYKAAIYDGEDVPMHDS